jgi:hypothetical protein
VLAELDKLELPRLQSTISEAVACRRNRLFRDRAEGWRSGRGDRAGEAGSAGGITQKQLICRAFAAAGVPIDPLDLEDRTPRRRAAA